ncbi:hypothetical protein ACQPZF_35745 [Actinosynnema sp. CS-041913]|uniref:hypothetical protein n=1 Tax=Actinosynnema sp. CS-041913 TaxID=3239917 RepID=UPI003D8AC98E
MRTLEVTDDVDQAFIRDINERRADLRSQRDELARQLAEAENKVQRAPNPTLLDYLPITPVDLVELPDELSRRLFEALRLEIHYDHGNRTATCRVTLLGDTINAVSGTTQEAVVIPFPKQKGPAMEMQDLPNGTVCVVPPAGDGSAPMEPLARALSCGGLFQDRCVRPDTPGLGSGGMGTVSDDI